MVRDEIEDPDEKPEERGNGKEPAASDNGLLGRPADQREKDGDTERQQEKRNHLYPLFDSRVSGRSRHASSYSFSLINSLKLAPRSRGPRQWDGVSPAGHT